MRFSCFVILQLFLVIFLSCDNRKKEYKKIGKIHFPKTIQLDLSNAEIDSMNLSDIAEKVEYIPMQTTESSLLDYFYDFKITSKYFFIKDGLKIVKYDNNGRFVKDLLNPGRGPEEALPVCFTLNDSLKLVYLYDQNKSVKIFDYDGNFKTRILFPINPIESLPPWRIEFFNNCLFVCVPQKPKVRFLYSFYDLENDSIRIVLRNYRNYAKLAEEKRLPIILQDFSYQITDSTVLFKERFSDTIFAVNRYFESAPRYIIDLGKEKLEWENWRDHGMFNIAGGPPNGYWVQSFIESRSFLIIVLRSFTEPKILAIYDKYSDSIKMSTIPFFDKEINQVFLRNDLDKIIAFPAMSKSDGNLFYYNECLYSVVEASEFADAYHKASEKSKRSTKYLRDLSPVLSQVNEFSNPVIMKIYLK